MQRPTIQLRTKDRRNKQSIWLSTYANNIKSQYGEDGIIAKIFDIIGIEHQFCVDFGCGDGQWFSNSYNLCFNKKWGGVLIEPSKSFEKLQELYKERNDVFTIHGKVGLNEDTMLDTILNKVNFTIPKNFDFLSIDVDGNDLWIWEDIKVYRPRVVCIEFNPCIADDIYFIQARDENVGQGSSLLAIIEKAKARKYEVVATTICNAFFVDAPYFPQFHIPNNSIEAMHFCGNDNKIILTYDGWLYTAGPCKNPWKNYTLEEERLQPIPLAQRVPPQY